MLYRRTGTIKGVDYYIDALQKVMYPLLNEQWGITDHTYDCYARAYHNYSEENKGYLPEWFIGNNDYKDILIDDTKTTISFFDYQSGEKNEDGQKIATVSIVFCVNVANVSTFLQSAGITNSAGREDEYVRESVETILDQCGFGLIITKLHTGVENALQNYPGAKNKSINARGGDMQPWHYFRFECSLVYSGDEQCIFNPVTEY